MHCYLKERLASAFCSTTLFDSSTSLGWLVPLIYISIKTTVWSVKAHWSNTVVEPVPWVVDSGLWVSTQAKSKTEAGPDAMGSTTFLVLLPRVRLQVTTVMRELSSGDVILQMHGWVNTGQLGAHHLGGKDRVPQCHLTLRGTLTSLLTDFKGSLFVLETEAVCVCGAICTVRCTTTKRITIP
jgi:hypothetical protein